ncbi:hypothetical protein EYF80_000015 [Liparis tanakae]|uniref:Uncharacterized protein n=1 Tax=Liparis tanakae TaxID=230148 RepID=A0A4Z2JJK1_9TELE|nr:hypothetical protein EYF80_000015 [Liparis tanakae]
MFEDFVPPLLVALPGALPTASRFHVAEGIIPSFGVCVRKCRPGQPTSQVAGLAASSRRLLSKAAPRLRLRPADDYEKSSQRRDITLRLLHSKRVCGISSRWTRLYNDYSCASILSDSKSLHLSSEFELRICDRLGQITKDYLRQTQPLHTLTKDTPSTPP